MKWQLKKLKIKNMAIIIEAVNDVYSLENNQNKKLFLAGGITNCPDWQSKVIEEIKDIDDLTVYNPRRKNFPMDDPFAAHEQITWEYNKLKESDVIVFWFAKGSINPIVLYELGRWGTSSKTRIIVGIDKEYERRQDVQLQTALARPDVKIVYSLDALVTKIKNAFVPCPV